MELRLVGRAHWRACTCSCNNSPDAYLTGMKVELSIDAGKIILLPGSLARTVWRRLQLYTTCPIRPGTKVRIRRVDCLLVEYTYLKRCFKCLTFEQFSKAYTCTATTPHRVSHCPKL